MTLTPLFHVTKGNKLSAKTAISRSLEDFVLITYRAIIYGLSEAEVPLGRVATLTGFEHVRFTDRNGKKVACRTNTGQIWWG